MVAGDIISGIFTTTATYNYFQPAGTNEIVITGVFGLTEIRCGLYDGVTQSWSYATNNGTQLGNNNNTKIGITNTNYLLMYATSTFPSYTGIQIK